MRPRLRTLLIVATTLAIVGVPHRANADPIVVTGGSIIQTFGIDLPGFTVTGTDSRFTGVLAIGGERCCGFSPGDLVDVSRSFPVSPLPVQSSTQIAGGTAYPDAYLRGSFTFTAVPFVAPPITGDSDSFLLTTSFDMTGQLSGFTGPQASPSLLFSVPIAGSGIATVSGSVPGGQFYVGNSIAFQFQDPNASPTPEPATVVLVGTAILGVFAAAARRREGDSLNVRS
jgi:hypothetical protein